MIQTTWKSTPKLQKIFWGLLIILTLFRIFLFQSIPLDAMANTPHDDLLLLTHAQSLLNGEWLGAYNNRTLVKGISFPVFVAVCKWLCIPYALGLALFYIFSILVFLRAIRSLVTNPYVMGFIYLFLLYSPAMLNKYTQQRPYNLAPLASTILLICGCCIGLFLRRSEGSKKLLPWSLLGGCSLAYFWFLREDSIWLLPFAAGSLLIAVICVLKEKTEWKKRLLSCGIMGLPFVILAGAYVLIASVNNHYYHTFTVNERTSSSFSEVMSDLVQMDAVEVRSDVWISRATLDEAMEFSPTLESIRESIDEVYASAWAVNGEVSGDIIAWALRDAVADAGYFSDGATSDTFFQAVHTELSSAYESGAYTKKPGIFLSSLSDGFVFSEDFLPLINRSLTTWKHLLFIDYSDVEIFPGSGSTEQLRFFEAMTDSPVVYPDNTAFTNDPVGPQVQRPVTWAKRFLKLYRLASYPLALCSVLCYLWMTVCMVMEMRKKKYDIWYLWLITTGLIGCCAILIVEVSWFTTYLGDVQSNIIYSYCSGALMMIPLVQIFSIVWGIQQGWKCLKIRKQ
ncbi:MAG: hypothetical protein EOM40_10550 [Clostridia bacterium]|nr:hypothetical protein [Clostridia bacterium]NCC44299.1 hypothetical protein [Clostridia bacterium]